MSRSLSTVKKPMHIQSMSASSSFQNLETKQLSYIQRGFYGEEVGVPRQREYMIHHYAYTDVGLVNLIQIECSIDRVK